MYNIYLRLNETVKLFFFFFLVLCYYLYSKLQYSRYGHPFYIKNNPLVQKSNNILFN